VAPFSSSGRTDWQGWAFFKPDLVAPGVSIPSAYPGGRVAWMSGTSMASPHVAGLLALSTQLRPQIPVRDRERIVLDSVRDLGPHGRGQRSGEGRLDVEAALRATAAYRVPAAPPKDFAPVYMRARRFRVK
jgi:serine protease AprX